MGARLTAEAISPCLHGRMTKQWTVASPLRRKLRKIYPCAHGRTTHNKSASCYKAVRNRTGAMTDITVADVFAPASQRAVAQARRQGAEGRRLREAAGRAQPPMACQDRAALHAGGCVDPAQTWPYRDRRPSRAEPGTTTGSRLAGRSGNCMPSPIPARPTRPSSRIWPAASSSVTLQVAAPGWSGLDYTRGRRWRRLSTASCSACARSICVPASTRPTRPAA